ncbi:MAG: ATP-dependent Clp protease proteolytic subunit, partial [Planctomycetia bacterium]|nr:ATP-dependent Clp protease proteolytic subunit [Planctomycetia bacterium]
MLNDELLLTRREIVVRGPITDQSANETVAKMLYLQHVNPTASITLHIHSPGGALTAGLAICDTMDIVRPAVHIRCHSIVFGVAAIIAAHGT